MRKHRQTVGRNTLHKAAGRNSVQNGSFLRSLRTLADGDALLVGSSAEIALALPLAAMTMPSVLPRTRCPLSRRPRLLGPRL